MVSHIDMIVAMVASQEVRPAARAVKALAAFARPLLLFCGAVPMLLDTHGRLFVRSLPLMTVEDRLIAAGVVALAYWLILGGLLRAVSWVAARSQGMASVLGATGLGVAAFAAVWWTGDVLFLLAHLACFTADWCQSEPVFAHLMHALAATSGRPGVISMLVVAAFAALALANRLRRGALWFNRSR